MKHTNPQTGPATPDAEEVKVKAVLRAFLISNVVRQEPGESAEWAVKRASAIADIILKECGF